MPTYELTAEAEEDINKIAVYTISEWGSKQASRYSVILDSHFDAIGNGSARTRLFLPHRPELRVSRVEHHYVFHLEREKRLPLILAVFHENMDLLARLRRRLED